jgi:hypothetical protein
MIELFQENKSCGGAPLALILCQYTTNKLLEGIMKHAFILGPIRLVNDTDVARQH